MGQTSAIVVGILLLLSVVVKNFWCRYLCPYGAMTGLVALVSPTRIRRNADACIDCAKCAVACPAGLPVDTALSIRSAECNACMSCVSVCPAAGALDLTIGLKRHHAAVPPGRSRPAIVLLFAGIVFYAQFAGLLADAPAGRDLPGADPERRRLRTPAIGKPAAVRNCRCRESGSPPAGRQFPACFACRLRNCAAFRSAAQLAGQGPFSPTQVDSSDRRMTHVIGASRQPRACCAASGGSMPIRVRLPELEHWKAQVKCQAACPVATDAGRYVQLVADGARRGRLPRRARAESVRLGLRPRLRRAVRGRLPPRRPSTPRSRSAR